MDGSISKGLFEANIPECVGYLALPRCYEASGAWDKAQRMMNFPASPGSSGIWSVEYGR